AAYLLHDNKISPLRMRGAGAYSDGLAQPNNPTEWMSGSGFANHRQPVGPAEGEVGASPGKTIRCRIVPVRQAYLCNQVSGENPPACLRQVDQLRVEDRAEVRADRGNGIGEPNGLCVARVPTGKCHDAAPRIGLQCHSLTDIAASGGR